MGHLGHVSVDSEQRNPDRYYANCSCGWHREWTFSHKEAAYWALEHSDEDALRYAEYDARLTWPDATFEEIHGLFDIVNQEPVFD